MLKYVECKTVWVGSIGAIASKAVLGNCVNFRINKVEGRREMNPGG